MLSLNVIDLKQVRKMFKLSDINFIHIQMKNVNQYKYLWAIQEEIFSHIYISSELMIRSKFISILQNKQFHNWVELIVIDELHLIRDWAFFCDSYSQLYTMKMILRRVLWAELTVICDQETHQTVTNTIQFNSEYSYIQMNINCLKMTILTVFIKSQDFNKFEVLLFLSEFVSQLDKNLAFISMLNQISKILMFMTFKNQTELTCQFLQSQLIS